MNRFNEIITNTSYYLDKVYEQSVIPKIPHITHRMWLTDPLNPREMMSVLTD